MYIYMENTEKNITEPESNTWNNLISRILFVFFRNRNLNVEVMNLQ